MNTLALVTGICLATAPWAAAVSSDPCCETEQPAAQVARLAPMTLSLGAPQARRVVRTAGQETQKGMIGVYLAEDGERAVVDGLVSGGPAEGAGLQPGDAIVAVDGTPVKGWSALSQRMANRKAGQEVALTVDRDGWRKEITLTLAPAPAPPAGSGNAAEAPSSGFVFEAAPENGAENGAEGGAGGAEVREKLRLIEEKISKQGGGQLLVEGPESPMTLRLRRMGEGEAAAPEGGTGVYRLELNAGEGECCEGEDCCEEGEACCVEDLTVLGDGAHVIRIRDGQVMGERGLPGALRIHGPHSEGGQVKGKARIVIRTDDGEEKVHELDLSDVRQWIGEAGDGQKKVELRVHGLPEGVKRNVIRKVEGVPHVLQWSENEPFPIEVDVEVESDGEHQGGEHQGGGHQSLWVTRKGDVTAPRVRFFQDGELKELTELEFGDELKDLGEGGVQVWTTPDGGAHTYQWRSDDDHEHRADDQDGDDRPRVRRRMLGLPAPPSAPAPPAAGGPVAGELRDLRRQLDELRRELRELRQALRRARAGAGGGMR